MSATVHKLNNKAPAPSYGQLKQEAVKQIVDRATQIAFKDQGLFKPNTGHLAYALLESEAEMLLTTQAFHAHIANLDARIQQLEIEIEALRKAMAQE